MKLYWSPRSRSFSALWALEESGLAYERVLTDISKGEQNTPAFHAINPMEKVPALVDGEARVAESSALIAYVAERAPHLAPPIGDPRRGRYLQWLVFASSGIEPAIVQLFTKLEMRTSAAGWGDAERVCNVLDEALATGPWLLGDEFSAADIAIGSGLYFAVHAFKIIPTRPNFDAYLARCMTRPAFGRAVDIDATGV